ncbi:hypothetical protein CMV30_16710 [Nibricoccus aquaticus]|uniref:Lipoprotein n=1 Tax=Nibricoccus aquaticus TaxID=2576891 RepID=A0A290QAA8_9BACT|nr:hypothetical protein [Nibricoccus aquaticus]ATC65454.1 hypothetical protein CMV30_16710 [Nibricoccus aquaticus]
MSSPRRNSPRLRRTFAFSLLAATLLLSGCVYLRLLDLKRQFARFDTHFKADTSDGVRIECLKPILLPDDVRWLGVFPETVTTDGVSEKWRVRWVKDAPPGEPETAVYDVELETRFIDDRLAYVGIPERYFAFFPKELFVSLLRSTGGARIDKSSRSAEVDNTPDPAAAEIKPPTIDSIGGMLGRPNERTTRDGLEIFRYRYRAMTPEKKAKPIEMTFAFDSATGRLQTLKAKLPTDTINFRVAPKTKP